MVMMSQRWTEDIGPLETGRFPGLLGVQLLPSATSCSYFQQLHLILLLAFRTSENGLRLVGMSVRGPLPLAVSEQDFNHQHIEFKNRRPPQTPLPV